MTTTTITTSTTQHPFLIPDDATLRRFFPNVLSVPVGSITFYDKLVPHLLAAELWLSQNIVDVELLRENESHEAVYIHSLKAKIYDMARRLVVAFAMHSAAPSLDLKLDANGFATVGTQNLVPISTQRMQRLLISLASTVDACIDLVLRSLHLLPGWLETEQARFFARSVFQDLSFVDLVPCREEDSEWTELMKSCPKFTRFLALREYAIEKEDFLAVNYFSRELLDALRMRVQHHTADAYDANIIQPIRSQIVSCLKGHHIDDWYLRTVVDFIRANPDKFPEWHSSDTVRLFDDTSFQNKKDSTAFFF